MTMRFQDSGITRPQTSYLVVMWGEMAEERRIPPQLRYNVIDRCNDGKTPAIHR